MGDRKMKPSSTTLFDASFREWIAESRTSHLKKDEFISFLSEHSFNVPSLSERLSILKVLSDAQPDVKSEASQFRIAEITAIVFSTAQIGELAALSDPLGRLISGLLSGGARCKLLDFVLSNDWGKLFHFAPEHVDSILQSVCDSTSYGSSDELASLLLKIASTSDGRATISRSVGIEQFRKQFLGILSSAFGRSGGLLRSCAFLTRREAPCASSDPSFSSTNLLEFLAHTSIDPLTRFSIVSLACRCFYIDLVELITGLGKFDRLAKNYCLMTMSRPFVVWSLIQRQCVGLGAPKFPQRAIERRSLADFFCALQGAGDFPPATCRGSVGVIMTTFNPNLELIAIAVRSVLAQTYRNLRLCIVDDNSAIEKSHALAELIDRLNDTRILLLRNEHNLGQYRSRNSAMEALAGASYFAIHDDDDFSHPDRLRLQVERLHGDTNAKLVMCQQARFSEDMRYVPDKVDPYVFDPSPASSLFRSEIVSVVGGFADVRSRGDVEFITRLKIRYGGPSIATVDAPLYLMRCTPETVSASKDRLLKTQLDVFRREMGRNTVLTEVLTPHALIK